MNYLPPQRSTSRFHMPIRTSQPSGFRAVYPQARQPADDLASVSSEQSMQMSDTQSDLTMLAKVEVEEVLRTFAQTTQQQRDQVVRSIQERGGADTPALLAWQAGLEQAIQGLPVAATGVSQRVSQTQEALHVHFTSMQTDISQGFRSLEDIIASVTASLHQQTNHMQTKLQNIEKRIVKRKSTLKIKPKEQQFYPPGALWPVRIPLTNWCTCILKAGRRMTRMERIKGIQEGRLVCTCRIASRK